MSCTNLSGNIGNCYEGIDLPYATGPQGADGIDGVDGVSIISNNWTAASSTTTNAWETLKDVTIPANTLSADGDILQVEALLTVDVASIATTLKIRWGTNDIVSFTYTPVDEKVVLLTAYISLTSTKSVQQITGKIEIGDNPVATYKSGLVTLSGGTLVDPTAISHIYIMSQKASNGLAGDIVLTNVLVKLLNI